MRNFDTFYAANSKYGSKTCHYSEPCCFEDEVQLKTIEALGRTEELTSLTLAQIIHDEIEGASDQMKVSLEGITLPTITAVGSWKATAQLKYQMLKSAS